jgi:hypothetical protein
VHDDEVEQRCPIAFLHERHTDSAQLVEHVVGVGELPLHAAASTRRDRESAGRIEQAGPGWPGVVHSRDGEVGALAERRC